MRRSIAITAIAVSLGGAVIAGLASWSTHNCGSWLPFGCHGADPELTRLVR